MPEEVDNTTWQFIRAYRHLMTEAETRAERAIAFQAKLDGSRGAGEALVQRLQGELQKALADTDAAELFKKGPVRFLRDAADRILAEHCDEIVRCRRCGGILRTPHAKQCLNCGYDWHS